MKVIWSDEAVFQLIEEVKKVEYIWNFRNPFYKNKLKKQTFWLQLVEELNNRLQPNEPFTYEEIIKKWNNLKSYYSSQRQRLFKAQKSGAGVEEIENIMSSWKFQSKLDFSMPNMEPTPSVNNFNKRSLQNLQSFKKNLPVEYLEEEYSQHIEGSGLNNFDDSPLTDSLKTTSTPSLRPETSWEWLSQSQAFDQRPSTLAKSKEVSSMNQSSSRTTTTSEWFPESQELERTSISNSADISISGHSQPQHLKRKPRALKPTTDETAAKLIKSSEKITQALQDLSNEPKKNTANSSFGVYIVDQLDKLDEELQILGRKKIADLIFELQQVQIKKTV